MSKITLSLIMIAAVGAIVVGAIGAYFSDTEISTGNTFTAGTLDLNLEGDNIDVLMFNVSSLAPGSSGDEEVNLENVGNLDGFLDISFLNLVNDDVSCNDPESDVDETCGTGQVGELADNLDVLAYLDENDNNVYNAGTDVLIYDNKAVDIVGEQLSDQALNSGSTKIFRLEWSVDSSVGNIIQSDNTGFDVEFELAQTTG